RAGIPVARPLWLDADGSQLGTPGYIMERVAGVTPAAGMFSQGLLAEAEPARRKALMLEGVAFHGRLRRAAIGPDQVPHLLHRGKGSSPVERELRWWIEEAHANTQPGCAKRARLDESLSWLLARIPPLRPAALVHGDAQFGNLMYRD